jgi:hypothetical protein
MESGLQVLGQLLLLSLVIERVIETVVTVVKGRDPSPLTEGTETWSRPKMICAGLLGAGIALAYEYDLLSEIINNSRDGWTEKAGGIVITAIVLAGGSAGIRLMIDALSAGLKSVKEQALLSYRRARLDRTRQESS